MLKDVTFGQYFPGDSVVHKMDPRMKLVLIIVYIVMLFVADGIIPLLLGVAVTVFAYAMSKLSFKLVWRSVKPILPIVVFTAILNIFSVWRSNKLYNLSIHCSYIKTMNKLTLLLSRRDIIIVVFILLK